MSNSAQWALQTAILDMLNMDADSLAALGNPVRLYDDFPEHPQYPFALFGRIQLRPLPMDESGPQEHRFTLNLWSRYGGHREALEALAALRNALDGANLTLNGYRLVSLSTLFADVLKASNGRLFQVVMRLRAVTEPII